jgi:hypothetical protein
MVDFEVSMEKTEERERIEHLIRIKREEIADLRDDIFLLENELLDLKD